MSGTVHFVAASFATLACPCGAVLADLPDDQITLDPDKVTCERALALLPRSLERIITVKPDDVQQGGIGAPQAHWLGLIDHGLTVSSVPQYGGPEQPRIAVRIVTEGRILTHEQARALSAALLSAIAWTGR